MAITFIIGNGLDLHMGMKTRYVDMYDGYIKSPSKKKCIADFKELLAKDEPNDYTTWADFESKMGEVAAEFKSEKDFVDCVRDFKEYLAYHLRLEEERFLSRLELLDDMDISKEMKSSFKGFYDSLIVRDRTSVFNATRGIHTYDVISFNYTKTFENLINKISFGNSEQRFEVKEPVHIHGTLDKGVLLGVDNELQISSNVSYDKTVNIKRSFIKPFLNNLVDPDLIATTKGKINSSSVICIYGLSLGPTDQMWIDEIINWLQCSSFNHLVYFKFSDREVNVWHPDLVLEVEDEEKDWFLKRIDYLVDEENRDISSQIHIPVAYDIFNILPMIEEKENDIIAEEEKQLELKSASHKNNELKLV